MIATPVPDGVAHTRRLICELAGCPHTLDYRDPCAACPSGHWGIYTICGRATPSPFPPLPSSPPPGPGAWPILLRPLRLLARSGDTGLGDIVERTIGPIGGQAFEKWYLTTFGRSCGCPERREEWNARYPLMI